MVFVCLSQCNYSGVNYFVHLIHQKKKKLWLREGRYVAETLNSNQFSTSMFFGFYVMPKADLQVGSEY